MPTEESPFVPPLGIPDQPLGLPTAPLDRGDEVQERFRYQSAIGLFLLAEGLTEIRGMRALWCEHHEDYLVELSDGGYIAVQVKTDGSENALWRLNDRALIKSIKRFCALEKLHGSSVRGYEFMSNASIYVPGPSASEEETISKSPARMLHFCRSVNTAADIPEPYLSAFNTLNKKTGNDSSTLISVLRKLRFRQGPSLRGYDDSLAAQIVNLPGCHALLQVTCCRLRDELMGLVEGACRLATPGVDGAVAYIASNGRPEVTMRGKCISLQSALEVIKLIHQTNFRFVNSGAGLKLGKVPGRSDVLQRKMRNAYVGGQFESLRIRMDSADQRLLEQALLEPEGFDEKVEQLVSAVLIECKDAEAMVEENLDERRIGPSIYRDVLKRMDRLAIQEPGRICNEPKDTLIGVAGMLSGECKFAWGFPLEDTLDGI